MSKYRINPLTVLLAVACLFMFILTVDCYAEQNEQNVLKSNLESRLTSLENDAAILSVKYEEKAEYLKAENYATTILKMQPVKDCQVQYINMNNDDVFEISSSTESQNVLERFTRVFSVVWEYLS